MLTPGTRLGAYEILALLGSGGMGDVYRATDTRLGRERIRVSSSGGSQPNWRADGRELFYLALDGTMMAVPMEVRGAGSLVSDFARPLFKTGLDVSTSLDQYAVAGDGSRFLVMAPAGGRGSAPLTVVVNWASGLGR